MTTSAFFDIEVAFQSKLSGISGAPFIEYENTKPYTPTIGTKFWRTNHLPGPTVQVTADALREHTGIYQVDVIVPPGKGLNDLLTDLDKIAGAFDTTTQLNYNNTKVQIQGVSRGRVSQEDNGWTFGFVKISYVCRSY